MAPFEQLRFEDLPEAPRVPHPFFEVPEQRVPVRTDALGATTASVRVLGAGPPLLLVHGLMTTSYSWRYVLAPYAERFTVIVPDLPGAGRSSCPDGPLTPEATADWLSALQRELDVRGCRVIGNSMGGYLTAAWALRDPGAVGRLVIGHAPLAPLRRLYPLWAVSRSPGFHRGLGALVRRDPERWAHRNVHYYDETLKSREETREFGLPLATDDGLRAFASQLRDTMDIGKLRRTWAAIVAAGGLPVPTRYVYARRDPMVPARIGHAVAKALPKADLVWLEHGSHFAHVDAVPLWMDATVGFLQA